MRGQPGKKVEERAFQVETKPSDLRQTPWAYLKLVLSFLMIMSPRMS